MNTNKNKSNLAGATGGITGVIGSVKAVSLCGSVPGLSAAGITSGLSTIGGVVGGGMGAGVAIVASTPLALATLSYFAYRLFSK